MIDADEWREFFVVCQRTCEWIEAHGAEIAAAAEKLAMIAPAEVDAQPIVRGGYTYSIADINMERVRVVLGLPSQESGASDE